MADHTGKRKKPKIDTNSISTTTLLSFVIFALFLVMVVWALANFFLNSYFERARAQEVMRTAETLESQFVQDINGFDSFTELGPGSVLQGLIRKINSAAEVDSKANL
jgi:malonyl CoA-acyl carrier protein transacylase